MIEIDVLRQYFEEDKVVITNHASERFRQRNIRMKDIRAGVKTGEIIEQYPEDFPFPSCLILGYTCDKRPIHIVMSDEGTSSRIITAYIPDNNKWKFDFKPRKE
ncbi:MAG: DUF4258 domain-containing protein [Lachnospiraceae bacterium]|nr:DUF4258 domain-containing protein [Lachnospiraceae bacterium]